MHTAHWYVVMSPLVSTVAARPGDLLVLAPECRVSPAAVLRHIAGRWRVVQHSACPLDPRGLLEDGVITPCDLPASVA